MDDCIFSGRFPSKAEARQAVWDALVKKRVARFPFPTKGRIPNFEGASAPAEKFVYTAVGCTNEHPAVAQRHARWGSVVNK
jgi:hypothetical protein